MGVGVQGEAGGEVAKHSADSFDVHTILKCNGCEGMSEVMESDLGNACSCQHSVEHIVYAIW